MKKTLLIIGTLALAGLASAKSYGNMIISDPVMAGGQRLAKGEYVLQLKGNTAVLTNLDTGKSYQTAVKVENAGHQFDNTAVKATSKDGIGHITSIDLGGSSTTIELGE